MDTVSGFMAYVWAAVIMVVFLLIAIVLSNMVSFKPNDPGTTKKRIIFWVCAALTFVAAFLVNIGIAEHIRIPADAESYRINAIIGSGAALVVFVIFGFIISKIFRQSKIGTWF